MCFVFRELTSCFPGEAKGFFFLFIPPFHFGSLLLGHHLRGTLLLVGRTKFPPFSSQIFLLLVFKLSFPCSIERCGSVQCSAIGKKFNGRPNAHGTARPGAPGVCAAFTVLDSAKSREKRKDAGVKENRSIRFPTRFCPVLISGAVNIACKLQMCNEMEGIGGDTVYQLPREASLDVGKRFFEKLSLFLTRPRFYYTYEGSELIGNVDIEQEFPLFRQCCAIGALGF